MNKALKKYNNKVMGIHLIVNSKLQINNNQMKEKNWLQKQLINLSKSFGNFKLNQIASIGRDCFCGIRVNICFYFEQSFVARMTGQSVVH